MEYLDRATLALKHVVSKEKSRYALNGINIECGRAIACDGRMVAIVQAPQKGNKVNGFKSAIIGADLLKKIEKNMPKVGDAELVETKNGLEITIPEGPDSMVIKAKALNGAYPDVDAIMPKGEPKIEISLNVDMLMALAKVAEAGGENKVLTLGVYDGKSPVKVTSMSNKRFSGLVLPVVKQ